MIIGDLMTVISAGAAPDDALAAGEQKPWQQMVAKADSAMYQAKYSGHNKVVVA